MSLESFGKEDTEAKAVVSDLHRRIKKAFLLRDKVRSEKSIPLMEKPRYDYKKILTMFFMNANDSRQNKFNSLLNLHFKASENVFHGTAVTFF